LAFNEIWAIKNFENLIVEGYDLKCVRTRENSRGGGVMIFGRDNIITQPINSPFIEGILETVGIKIGNTVLINIYRPPSGNRQIFVDELCSFLDSINGLDIIITGDFNINFLENNNILEAVCNQYGIETKIKRVTRIASHTCLDNFITNLNGTFSVSNICIADHQAIKAKIKLQAKLKKRKTGHSYREMKEINWLLFKNGVHNMTPIGQSVEDRWDSISTQVKKLVEECFPLKTTKNEYKFFMSKGLLKSRDRKNKLLREFKRGKISKDIYINYNKLYRKLIQAEQEKSFKNNMNNAGNNGKKKWKVIKKELLIEKDNKSIVELTINGNKVTDGQTIANSFKDHFKNCATELAKNYTELKN